MEKFVLGSFATISAVFIVSLIYMTAWDSGVNSVLDECEKNGAYKERAVTYICEPLADEQEEG